MAAVWHVDLQLVVLAGQESAWENNRLQSYLAAAEKGSESETHDMSLKVLISLDILRLTGCNKHTKKNKQSCVIAGMKSKVLNTETFQAEVED